MEHHHHHEHVHQLKSLNKVFIICILLNLIYVCLEAGVGFWQNSLGLLSDAGHNLSDVFSLLLALIAFKLTKISSNNNFTYGYKKSTALISLTNAIILLIAVGAIVLESVHKLNNPQAIDGNAVSWTAGIGILINGLTAFLLMKSGGEDLNVRGAFLHMAADTLVSVGVVVSGLIISFTGFYIIDPIVSLIVAAVILISTWSLLTKSLRLCLDGVPPNINHQEIVHHISENEHIKDIHHVHIWAISTTENAITAHVAIDNYANSCEVKNFIREELEEHGITHSTLELELEGECCQKQCC